MIWFIQILYLLCGIEVNFIKAHTKGYKRKANSHCEKGKVTVLVSLEKRDLEAGEEQETLKKEKSSYENFESQISTCNFS